MLMETDPLKRRLLALTFLIASTSSLSAQTTSASLAGTITDPTGSAIPGATVTVRNSATGERRTTTSDSGGRYSLTSLSPATYEVQVRATGFQTALQSRVQLNVGGSVTDDVPLAIGNVDQVIQVTTDQRDVDTSEADVSQVVGQHEIDNLPNIGRNFVNFVKLDSSIRIGRENVGGGPFKEPDVGVGVAAVPRLSFGGQSELNTMLQVDGVDNVQTWTGLPRATPSQEAVQEFRIVNSTYLAEYGRSLAGFINIVTKSGTDKLAGSLYFYGINTALNARSAISTPTTNILRQNQFGAVLSGPIKKEKSFFFLNYEGQRRAQSNNFAPLIVQNLAALNAVKARFNLTPETANQLRTNNYDQGWTRIDQKLTAANTLTARFNYLRSDTLNYPGGIGRGAVASSSARNAYVKDYALVASDLAVLTPKLVNEARFQYAKRTFDYPATVDEPTLEVSNLLLTGRSYADFDSYHEARYGGSDAVTYSIKSHTIRFGIDFNYIQDFSNFAPFFPARIIFSSLPALLAFSSTSTSPVNGPTVFWWSFLTGSTANPSRLPFNHVIPAGFEGSQYANINHEQYGAFVQDQWKATNKLTLTGGVRYDVETFPAPYETQVDGLQFQPRVGFAYAATSKTVVRGGFGKFTGLKAGSVAQLYSGVFAFSRGNLPDEQLLDPNDAQATGAYTVANVTPAQGPGAPTAAAIRFLQTGLPPATSCLTTTPPTCVSSQTDGTNNNLKNPYSLQGSAQIEQDLFKGLTLTFGYLYVHSVGNPLHSPNLNAEAAGQTGTELDGEPMYSNVKYSDAGNFAVIGNFGFSTYDGGSVTATKRFSSNFSVRGGYTWSKTLSNGDGASSASDFPETSFKEERGLSRQDLRHRMNLSGSASVPNTVRFAKGLEFSAQGTVESGRPYTVFAGSDLNGDGNPNNDRAGHIVGSAVCPQGCILRRNSYLGPGFVDMDARVGKQFTLSERLHLEVSMDAFNLLNNRNISDLNTVCGGINADACPNNVSTIPGIAVGSVQNVFNARQFQYGAKLSF